MSLGFEAVRHGGTTRPLLDRRTRRKKKVSPNPNPTISTAASSRSSNHLLQPPDRLLLDPSPLERSTLVNRDGRGGRKGPHCIIQRSRKVGRRVWERSVGHGGGGGRSHLPPVPNGECVTGAQSGGDCTQVRDEGGWRAVNLYSARICKRVRERKIPTRETEERKEEKGERRRGKGGDGFNCLL